MNKKTKIILIVSGICILSIGAYLYFTIPKIVIQRVDWINRTGSIKFGNKNFFFRNNGGDSLTYKGYKITSSNRSGLTFIKVFDRKGNIVAQKTIDYNGRIIY